MKSAGLQEPSKGFGCNPNMLEESLLRAVHDVGVGSAASDVAVSVTAACANQNGSVSVVCCFVLYLVLLLRIREVSIQVIRKVSVSVEGAEHVF